MARICSKLLLVFSLLTVARISVADLYVVQVGDGSESLSNASTVAFIEKFDKSGTFLEAINLPTIADAGHMPFTLSGTASTEGYLALSSNGEYLTLGGYGVGPGIATIAQTESAVVNRVIGRIEISSGEVDTTTALPDAYHRGSIRSVVTSDGTKFWTGGTATTAQSGGVRFTTLGSTSSAQISTSTTNVRAVDLFNDQLYASALSGAFRGVSAVGTGLPESADVPISLLPGIDPDSGSPRNSNEFWFKDASTLYIADERAVASGGGIEKWSMSGGIWSHDYTLMLGTGSGYGARGLTGTIVEGNAVLFATTTNNSSNRLMTVTDTGAGSIASELAMAPTNTVFRGLAYVSSVVPPDEIAGDYNGDGTVDAADYVVWRDYAGSSIDLNGDEIGGTIGPDQYAQWQSNFENDGSASGAENASVPEPATIALLLVGLPIASLRRRFTRRRRPPTLR